MTDTPKKPGRPRKATAQEPKVTAQKPTTPQESTVQQSKPGSGTPVPANPEIDTQRLDAIMARHMVKDHRMTWGETRIALGYGLNGQDEKQDEAWLITYRAANDVR